VKTVYLDQNRGKEIHMDYSVSKNDLNYPSLMSEKERRVGETLKLLSLKNYIQLDVTWDIGIF
jgi:hypothetical protein